MWLLLRRQDVWVSAIRPARNRERRPPRRRKRRRGTGRGLPATGGDDSAVLLIVVIVAAVVVVTAVLVAVSEEKRRPQVLGLGSVKAGHIHKLAMAPMVIFVLISPPGVG